MPRFSGADVEAAPVTRALDDMAVLFTFRQRRLRMAAHIVNGEHLVPEPEDEPIEHMTYQELYVRVNELAAYFQGLGLKAGDRIVVERILVNAA